MGTVPVDPPYTIRTERLLLRCWEPADATLLGEALDASLDHLRAWMPWAHHEPTPTEEKVERLRRFRGQFDLGQNFVYGIFDLDESRVLGGTGLHPRSGDGNLEIGYWIRAEATGRGYATEASAALTRVAVEVCGVERVEIHVDPANEASAAIPRRLGYVQEATLRRRLDSVEALGPKRDVVVFTMLAEELAESSAASVAYEAWDAAGMRVVG